MTCRYAAKYTYASAVTLAVLALLTAPHITDKYLMFAPMIGFGTGWTSMMGVPLMIVVRSIPKKRRGVYMGIVNVMIVVPMLIETVAFNWIYKTFLGASPSNAVIFVGVPPVIATSSTVIIETSNKPVGVSENA